MGLPGSEAGRNPLPDPKTLQVHFKRWGIRRGRQVIVYDEGRGLMAGRAWWVLRWAGLDNVRILDGGLANYRRHGFPTLTGPGNFPVDSNVQVAPRPEMTASIADIHDIVSGQQPGILLDARDASRYEGRRETLDLKAGRIPGAVNIPERELHRDDRTFKSREDILALFQAQGIDHSTVNQVVVYSGSGNHGALILAAMEYVGLSGARHYVGGWSQWSANPSNPIERGLPARS